VAEGEAFLAGLTEAMTTGRLFFGLRNARAREWAGLVVLEMAGVSWWARARMLGVMVGVWWAGERRPSAEWRRRMRVCAGCDLFDVTRHRCRPWDGSGLGCGCWTPITGLYEDHCWGWENVDEGFGW
jgi:hypothetical protein